MTDLPPETSGEKSSPPLEFGSIIKFHDDTKPSSPGYEFLVVQIKPEYQQVEAMRLPKTKSEAYGMPGTENFEDIAEVVGVMGPDKAVECLARAFMVNPHDKVVDPRFLELARKLLPPNLQD